VNKNSQEPTGQVSARRKLIRGAFSLPAVLAVHNGSALAASSNKMRCAVNALTNPLYPISNVDSAGFDSWMRVQRYKRNSDQVPFVRMTEINAMALALGGIDVAIIATLTQSIQWSNGDILSPDAKDLVQDGNNQVALRFDANGLDGTIRIVGIVTGAQSGGIALSGTNAITTSCWTSMM